MSAPLRIAIPGAAGRMGQLLLREVLTADDLTLSGASERPGHPLLGKDVGTMLGLEACGVNLSPDLEGACSETDVLIDFTVPAATRALIPLASARGCRAVVGTTGLTADDKALLAHAAAAAAIVFAPNMSVGVNVLLKLVAEAARLLGEDFDIEIVEAHHKHKKDAPSGTALRLAEVLAEATAEQGSLAERACFGRHGDDPRRARQIGIHTVRGGDVAGDHTVMLLGDGERLGSVTGPRADRPSPRARCEPPAGSPGERRRSTTCRMSWACEAERDRHAARR